MARRRASQKRGFVEKRHTSAAGPRRRRDVPAKSQVRGPTAPSIRPAGQMPLRMNVTWAGLGRAPGLRIPRRSPRAHRPMRQSVRRPSRTDAPSARPIPLPTEARSTARRGRRKATRPGHAIVVRRGSLRPHHSSTLRTVLDPEPPSRSSERAFYKRRVVFCAKPQCRRRNRGIVENTILASAQSGIQMHPTRQSRSAKVLGNHRGRAI